jgi:hypothetical protein
MISFHVTKLHFQDFIKQVAHHLNCPFNIFSIYTMDHNNNREQLIRQMLSSLMRKIIHEVNLRNNSLRATETEETSEERSKFEKSMKINKDREIRRPYRKLRKNRRFM